MYFLRRLNGCGHFWAVISLLEEEFMNKCVSTLIQNQISETFKWINIKSKAPHFDASYLVKQYVIYVGLKKNTFFTYKDQNVQ